jgi:hypothetical protein
MITAKIDVTKINKNKLFKGKNGAMYLDIVLIDTPNNQYGNDYMVVEQVIKEEREKGVKGTVLGNGKNVGANRPGQGYSEGSNESSSNVSSADLPF